jgi:hypothetical protein
MPLDLMRTGRLILQKPASPFGLYQADTEFRPGGCVIRDREIYGKNQKLIDGK